MPEPFHSGHDEYLARYLKTDEKKIIGIGREVQGRHRDGSVFPLYLGISEMKIGDQRMFMGTVQNISARKQSEISLRESEIRLKTIVDSAVDGIISIDDQGFVLTFNPAAEKLFGYGAEEVIGKKINMLMPEPYYSEHDSYLMRYATTGVKKIIGIGREVRGRNKNGSVFPIYLSVGEMEINGRCL